MIQEEVPLRADAARNRDKVLAAAERLFAEHGPDCVSMDAVAAEAGVGKGTLFRGFGDRAGLVLALLTEQERRLQEDIIRGPAPLGPGAPPVERLIAFGERLFEHYARHGELIAAAEKGAIRYRSAPFAFYRLHVQTLVRGRRAGRGLGIPRRRPDAPPSASTTSAICSTVREMSDERIAAGWADLVRRLLG